MGYQTQYTLKALDPLTMEEIEDQASIIGNFTQAVEYAIDSNGDCIDSVTWYDWETDTREFSKNNPSYIFFLSGIGEETGDMWRAYFFNGKAQIIGARIEYDPFDLALLK
jgi:hypothetical protein